jgi:transposase-like protein
VAFDRFCLCQSVSVSHPDHRKRSRTTNGLERLNKEIAHRTRVATLFPNKPSLLRLATAVLREISDGR